MALLLPFDNVHPAVDATAWVAPNATLIGKVILAERASIYYGAVLRADVAEIRIGARTNLQDNVTVHCDEGHPTIVGDGVSVGHAAVLHACTIEDECLIGMGSIVLSGSVIGAGSLVAAGAVVLEGTIVPPGSLVAGVPAKVRRELTAEEQVGMRKNGEHYLGYTEKHRALG